MGRLRILSVLGFFLIMVGAPFNATAQTPEDLQLSGTVTDAEGEEVGVITVLEAEDEFDGYAAGWEPAEEVRYVLLTVSFEATGDVTFDANPGRLVLRAVDGFHWVPYQFARVEESPPQLQAQTMSPGNRISGVVGFQVPVGVDLDSVYYQPEGSRLILLARLSHEPEQAPVLDDEVPYSSVTVEGAEGIVIVTDLEDPFEDMPEDVVPAEGGRYLIVTVSFESTGEAAFDASPNSLLLRDTDGNLWSYTSVPREDPTPPELQTQTLSPGDRISGVVGFLVPEDAELSELFWQSESGRLIRLVDFQATVAQPEQRR